MSLNHSLSLSSFSNATGQGGRLENYSLGNVAVKGFAANPGTAHSSAYTITANDYWVPVNTTSAAVTVTLPAAAAVPPPAQGQMWVVTDVSGTAASNNITISAGSGTSLYGPSGVGTISTNRATQRFIYSGSNYFQI